MSKCQRSIKVETAQKPYERGPGVSEPAALEQFEGQHFVHIYHSDLSTPPLEVPQMRGGGQRNEYARSESSWKREGV